MKAFINKQAMGATEVLITDVMENRLEVAKSLGADHVYKVNKPLTIHVDFESKKSSKKHFWSQLRNI